MISLRSTGLVIKTIPSREFEGKSYGGLWNHHIHLKNKKTDRIVLIMIYSIDVSSNNKCQWNPYKIGGKNISIECSL